MRTRRRLLLRGCLCAALSGGACATFGLARDYPADRSAIAARDDLRAAQGLLRERRLDTTAADLAFAEVHLDGAERDLRAARGRLDDPLVAVSSRLPLLGDSIDGVLELTDMGIESVALGRDLVAAAQIYQSSRQGDAGGLAERADAMFAELDVPMASMRQRLEELHQRRERLAGVALPPGMADAVAQLDQDLEELDSLAETYDSLSGFVPRFLGFDRPRRYLVLAQNNAELMPTGGLISVFGVISLADGRVVEREFADAVTFGADWIAATGAYVEPPGPLKRHLLRGQSWSLSVANWSADFPTAAQEALRFYELGGGSSVDGVIAINVRTIEELLGVTGPLNVPGYPVVVSEENALDVIEAHTRTGQAAGEDRKAFVGALAEALLVRLTDLPSSQRTPLVDAMQRLRDERQLFFYSNDPSLQALSAALDVDGSLVDVPGDYLMAVDASVNSTKLNIALEQSIGIEVHLDRGGVAHHRTTLSYHNNLPAWEAGRDPALVQRLMLGGVYGGYVRLLTPPGSELESVLLDGVESGAEAIEREGTKTSFGRFFSLPSGASLEVTFRHSTSGLLAVDGDAYEYRLYVQKQSGTSALPVTIALRLPDGAMLASASLDGEPVERISGIATDLGRDRELVVRYRLDE